MQLIRLSRTRGAGSDSESGVYIPLFAITLLGLIAMAALAIDAGNLYWRKLQLQSVADLAAAGGLGYRALQGWAYFQGYDKTASSLTFNNKTALSKIGICDGVCPDKVTELKTRTQEIVRANLLIRGLDPGLSNISALDDLVKFEITTDRIEVSVTYNVPLYLMSYFSFLQGCSSGHSCPIQAKTSAKIREANLLLALDRSGSMNCPSVDPNPAKPCGCRTNATFPNCTDPLITDEGRKMHALREATFNFMSYFNPNKDRVSVVPFQTIAGVAFTIRDGANAPRPYGPAFADLDAAVMGMTAGGNTNHCDALWTGYSDLAATVVPGGGSIPGNEPFFTLLFSDGAPTAGRFAYEDGNTAGTELKTMMDAQGLANDWLQYVVEWRDASSNRWAGPSPLVYRPAVGADFSGGVPAADIPVCGNFLATNIPPMESDASKYHTIFHNGGDADKPCLNSYSNYPTAIGSGMYTAAVSKDGGTSQVGQALDYANQLGNPTSPHWYIQKYYDCAIEAADYLRRRGGMVFTIGLGPAAYLADGSTPPIPNLDPYQNPMEDFTRKEFFLRRLAYDRYHANLNGDPSFKKGAGTIAVRDPNDARVGNQVWAGYTEHKNYGDENVGDRTGTYSGTNNPAELEALFTRVAKDILLQLVQ